MAESFYVLSCGNSQAAGTYPETAFSGPAEAIQTAADYEATLYRVTYQDGQQTGAQLLYSPDMEA